MSTVEYAQWSKHLSDYPLHNDFRTHWLLAQLICVVISITGTRGKATDPKTWLPWYKDNIPKVPEVNLNNNEFKMEINLAEILSKDQTSANNN